MLNSEKKTELRTLLVNYIRPENHDLAKMFGQKVCEDKCMTKPEGSFVYDYTGIIPSKYPYL